MEIKRLLVANRGEIAIRVMRTAAELGIRTVAMHSADDAQSLHTRCADEVRALDGSGVAAYLDAAQLVAVAREAGCDAIHPGYGFLSENASFARLCADAGLLFVGPRPATLELFGDKAAGTTLRGALRRAGDSGNVRSHQPRRGTRIPCIAGTRRRDDGQGDRRRRRSRHARWSPTPISWQRRSSAAGPKRSRRSATANVYVERLFPHARHIEVQVLGDGTGAVSHLWERECSLQRERQKLIEIAPAPFLHPAMRQRLLHAATHARIRRRLPERRHVRIPGRRDAQYGRCGDRLHRGERAAAGRAYGDRGGHRHRSGAGAA